MKRDIASGKLDAVLREVDDDTRAGRLSDRTHRRFWERFDAHGEYNNFIQQLR
jgi:hypothetical protein